MKGKGRWDMKIIDGIKFGKRNLRGKNYKLLSPDIPFSFDLVSKP